MAYLFKRRPPKCAEEGCGLRGIYDVRSSVLFGTPLPAPRCLRHAKRLLVAIEAEEERALGPAEARERERRRRAPAGDAREA